jgi:hypothetical protein
MKIKKPKLEVSAMTVHKPETTSMTVHGDHDSAQTWGPLFCLSIPGSSNTTYSYYYLCDRLQLLRASRDARNTALDQEIVHIMAELRRNELLSDEEYQRAIRGYAVC